MGQFEALLVVQELDTTLDQLEHRKASLPERAALTEGEKQLSDIEQRRVDAQARHDELGKRSKRIEDEVALLDEKISQEEDKLYKSGMTSAKDAQLLQEEIASLRRRKSDLEDGIIELMEEIEPVDGEMSSLAEDRETVDGEMAQLRAALGTTEGEIDAEIAEVSGRRADEAAGIDPGLLDEYVKLRSQLDGVGVASFSGGRCHGCPLNLLHPAMETDRINHEAADAVIHCDECSRILVRV
jgi:predicted  nucleic acid-binding Zn-ribbon protein